VEPIPFFLNPSNAEELLKDATVVVDATDNARTRYPVVFGNSFRFRYLINDTSARLSKPLVSGSSLRWEGQISVYNFKHKSSGEKGPCYRCIFPTPPSLNNTGACDQEGVIGPAPGIIGVMQVRITTAFHRSRQWKQ
jgi:adenylyltransferase and sulfurtransferase